MAAIRPEIEVAKAKFRLKSKAAYKSSVTSQEVQLRGGIWVQNGRRKLQITVSEKHANMFVPVHSLCTRKSCPFCRPTHQVVSSAQLGALKYGSNSARNRSREGEVQAEVQSCLQIQCDKPGSYPSV